MINSERKKYKVLIVDDMPINIQVLAGVLKADYHVKIATSGKKAIEIALSQNPPDLILLDIMMPEMDGYEVCRQLKSTHQTKDIPVIFITAKAEVEDETLGLELGAADYITKPFHPAIVKTRVKTQMRLKQKTDMLERLVRLDGLTDIPNRRYFDEAFEKEWARARRCNHPLSLIMMDIDYFKQFNDNYGHAAGDNCLKQVAQTLADNIKGRGDLVARIGGEEFAAVLPETCIKKASEIAEDFRSNIESLDISHPYSEASHSVTISVGVASFCPSVDEDPKRLIEIADEMLYKAKNSGRNQVACFMNISIGKINEPV